MKERRVVLSRDLRLAIMGKADDEACCGRDLAEALAKARLPIGEAKAWHRDLQRARRILTPPTDKGQ